MANNSSSGIGVFSLLGIAFVILKLCKVINWSWWYVTLPFWGGFMLFFIVFVIIAIIESRSK